MAQMSEIVGRELKRWSETLEELNEYDITLVNILLKYYEALIEAGGTAGGKRANKFVEYIGEKKVYVIKLLRLYHLAQKQIQRR